MANQGYKIQIQIGRFKTDYELFQTNAPKGYDGFGTLEVSNYRELRMVVIEEKNREWQLMRYASGNKSAEAMTGVSIGKMAEDKMLDKLFGGGGK